MHKSKTYCLIGWFIKKLNNWVEFIKKHCQICKKKLIFKVNQVFTNRSQRGFFLFRKISVSVPTPENHKTKKKKTKKKLTKSLPLLSHWTTVWQVRIFILYIKNSWNWWWLRPWEKINLAIDTADSITHNKLKYFPQSSGWQIKG